MTKKVKAICKVCGPIELEIYGPFLNSNEEGFTVPTVICPTIQSLGKFFKGFDGLSYLDQVGNRMSDDFEKGDVELLHTNPDEDGEDWADHKLKPLQCWIQKI